MTNSMKDIAKFDQLFWEKKWDSYGIPHNKINSRWSKEARKPEDDIGEDLLSEGEPKDLYKGICA